MGSHSREFESRNMGMNYASRPVASADPRTETRLRNKRTMLSPTTLFDSGTIRTREKMGASHRKKDVETAVAEGLMTLKSFGHLCDVSARDFERWFQAETPYPDVTMEEVIDEPLLVMHEIVEIDEVKKSGLTLEKDAIITNLELVDKAHFKAAQIEMEVALALGNRKHVSERLKDIRNWSWDPLTSPDMKRRYSDFADRVSSALTEPMRKR